jgi:hypothetical protein
MSRYSVVAKPRLRHCGHTSTSNTRALDHVVHGPRGELVAGVHRVDDQRPSRRLQRADQGSVIDLRSAVHAFCRK